jgi:hypothetical protein
MTKDLKRFWLNAKTIWSVEILLFFVHFCTFVGMCLTFQVQLHLSLSSIPLSCSSLTLRHESKVRGHEETNGSSFQWGKQHA